MTNKLSEVVEDMSIAISYDHKHRETYLWLPQNQKAARILEKWYTAFEASIFTEYLKWLRDTKVTAYDAYSKNISKWQINTIFSLVRKDAFNMWYEVHINENLPRSIDKETIAHEYVNKWLDVYSIKIKATPPEQYKQVVPTFVENAYIDNKRDFDNTYIIYPEVEEIQYYNKNMPVIYDSPLDDPILVGTLDSTPWVFYLIAYWKEDVDFKKIIMSRQNIKTEEKLPNVLI